MNRAAANSDGGYKPNGNLDSADVTTTHHTAKHWLLTFCIAVLSCVTLCSLIELHRRAQGHLATVRDDLDLWALERARVSAAGPNAIAILGTSRILYGLDPDVLARALPGKVPIMLAVNGSYPLAAFSDLARDVKFTGTALVDVDARGLSRYYRDMQQAQVRRFNDGVGPSAAVHRRLLSVWQASLLLGDADLGVMPTLNRVVFGAGPPQPRHATIAPNRAGSLDFQYPNINTAAMAANFTAGVLADYQDHPPPAAQLWLSELDQVVNDVRAIYARGGQVLFFCSATSGAHLSADQKGYPRTQYWDRFAREIAEPNRARAIYALDIPAIAALRLPDSSHIDQRDRAAFSEAIARLLSADK